MRKYHSGWEIEGISNVVVREFQPDKLKISVTMNHPQTDGWLKPTDLKARVHLTNLFGTPATERKVKGALTVSSGMPRFAQFKDYNFFDPLKPRYVSVARDVVTNTQIRSFDEPKIRPTLPLTRADTIPALGHELLRPGCAGASLDRHDDRSSGQNTPRFSRSPQLTRFTGGMTHDPSRMDGASSSGQ